MLQWKQQVNAGNWMKNIFIVSEVTAMSVFVLVTQNHIWQLLLVTLRLMEPWQWNRDSTLYPKPIPFCHYYWEQLMSPSEINLKTTLFDAPWISKPYKNKHTWSWIETIFPCNENVKARERTERHFRCFVFRSSTGQRQIDFSSIFLVFCVSSYTDVKNLSWKSNLPRVPVHV